MVNWFDEIFEDVSHGATMNKNQDDAFARTREEHRMKYQQATKSTQKERSKTPPSSSPHQTSLNHVTVHPLLELQRTIGNQAVQNLLHSQNTQINTTTQAFIEPRFSHDFSRIPIHSTQTAVPQTKLQVNQPGDIYEQEADQVAEQVMRMTDTESPISEGEYEANNSLMRKQSSEPRASAATNLPGVPPVVHAVLSNGGGQLLDTTTRAFMEPRFGHDFSTVRVHTDAKAADSARSVNALAYTVGQNVVFDSGYYQPWTRAGKQLLAHELAHVVQQSRVADRTGPHTLAASLSQVPSHQAQRQLIATGDPSGFAALANSVIAVQQEVVVSAAGLVSLRSTGVQGPPTPEAQELLSVLRTVINDKNPTTIEFIHGTTSTRSSDARVMVGSYPQSKLDLDDIAAFGTQEGMGLGHGRTAGALLSHEITEQYRKQVHGEAFPVAHPQGEAAESQAVGGTRGTMTQRVVNSTTIEFTVPYTYPDGRVVEVKWDVVSGNVTNIRRRLLPKH